MPAISSKSLMIKILEAIQQSDGVVAYVSESSQIHPKKYLVHLLDKTYSLWVYIWTLTHGGRVSLPNEYRIQMTSVLSPLQINPNGITLLMGYHPDLDLFAGFDVYKHLNFTKGSPSIQISLSTLHEALQNGLSFTRKENDEIAMGVRLDQFLTYCLNSEKLHLYGSEKRLNSLLQKVVSLETFNQKDIEGLSEDRKIVIENIQKKSRKANFKKTIMNAYENRCAVTRVQLNLVDAAHILPVAFDQSSDDVSNGIALSPTFHRAYDRGLIYLDENYIMRLNQGKVLDLKRLNLIDGLNTFESFLNKKVHIPRDVSQRPNVKYIELANRLRCVPGYS